MGARRYSPNLAYAQSKLADLMLTRQLAAVAAQRGWNLLSTAAHPGFTRTNLQTRGREPRTRQAVSACSLLNSLDFLPSQGVEQGTEPLLYAATSPEAVTGGYYGPGGWCGLVGPTVTARPPRGPSTPRPTPACGPRPNASPASPWPPTSPDRSTLTRRPRRAGAGFRRPRR